MYGGAKVGDVTAFLAGAKIDVLTIIALLMYSVHKRYLVLGRELDREVLRADTAEKALAAATEQNVKANEANAKMAALVPDLLRMAAGKPEASRNAAQE